MRMHAGRLAGGVFFLLLVGMGSLQYLRKPVMTPFARGLELAQANGCFACHGQGGVAGIANPRAENDIPAWDGGNAEMYLESDADIRGYIEVGRPARDAQKVDSALIRMPAYGNRLSAREIDALVAYVKGVSSFYPGMSDSIRIGMGVAREKGCFGCHGPSGRGGLRNPGSFKGIIPGWDSPEFKELARDSGEVGEWIHTGSNRRLEANPVAGYFLHRQRIRMPGYDSTLSIGQVESIKRYIGWMQTVGM